MKSTIAIVAVIVLLGFGVWLSGDNPAEGPENGGGLSGRGSVVFGITDAAAEMKGIADIHMTVSLIELHAENDSWVTVSSEPKSYALLALNASGDVQLAGWNNAAAGAYDEARVTVDKVEVEMTNGTRKVAKLPSGVLNLKEEINVTANATSTVTLDFLGDESLHMSGNGTYIFLPVVKAETRENNEVSVDAQGKLKVNGGTVRGNSSFGMDINGQVKKGFKVKADAKIELDAKGEIKLPAGLLKIESGASSNATSSMKTADVLNKVEEKVQEKFDTGLNINLDGAVRVAAFTVTASNFKFDKTEIRVKQGDKVVITLKNAAGFHDLKLDAFAIATPQLQTGTSAKVEFVANKKGTFEYYCSIGEHRAMGMKGNLIVE